MILESVQADGVPLGVARPADPPPTGVEVLHQVAGYPPQTASWLTRLARMGHLAVAPMLLHRHGADSIGPFSRFAGDLTAFARFLPATPACGPT
jgi:carboxymethylenebutenolidase